jgi:hypothetical protein
VAAAGERAAEVDPAAAETTPDLFADYAGAEVV